MREEGGKAHLTIYTSRQSENIAKNRAMEEGIKGMEQGTMSQYNGAQGAVSTSQGGQRGTFSKLQGKRGRCGVRNGVSGGGSSHLRLP